MAIFHGEDQSKYEDNLNASHFACPQKSVMALSRPRAGIALHPDESIGSPPAIDRAARLSTPAPVRAVDSRPAPLTGQPCDDNAAVAQG